MQNQESYLIIQNWKLYFKKIREYLQKCKKRCFRIFQVKKECLPQQYHLRLFLLKDTIYKHLDCHKPAGWDPLLYLYRNCREEWKSPQIYSGPMVFFFKAVLQDECGQLQMVLFNATDPVTQGSCPNHLIAGLETYMSTFLCQTA